MTPPESTKGTEVRVEYFATLKDQRGRAAERLLTDAATPEELYGQLKDDHGFNVPRNLLRVAVNDAVVAWDHSLSDGDRVVFIPPVSGGTSDV